MSGHDAPSDEMPKFARQARLGREHEELALDMLLDGMPLPPEAPPEMSALPPLLADLSGPAGPSELAGEAVVLSRFRRHASPAGVSSRRKPERRMPSWQSPARRAQLAAALAVVAIGLGSITAAYTGVLPTPVQELAYHVIGAPAPRSAPHHPGTNPRRHLLPAGSSAQPGARHGQLTPAAGHGHPVKLRLVGPDKPPGNGHQTPPGQRSRPTHPAHPNHPSHPAHPGQPSHPAHPSHPAPTPASSASASGFQSPGHGPHSEAAPPGHTAGHRHHRAHRLPVRAGPPAR